MTKEEIVLKLNEIGIYNIDEVGIEINENLKYLKIEFEVWIEEDVFGENCEAFKDFYENYYSHKLEYVGTFLEEKKGVLKFVYENGLLKTIENKLSRNFFFETVHLALNEYLDEIYKNLLKKK